MAEQVLEQDLQRDGSAGQVQPVADGVQPEVRVAVVTDLQRGAGAKGIDRGCRDAIEHASFVNRAVRGPSRRRTGAPVPGRDRGRV